jgi:cytochrome c oxidase subunit III
MPESNDRNAAAADGTVDVFADYTPEVKIRTKKMMMWFIIFAVVMLFAGITSALIVLWGKLYWLHVSAPSMMWTANLLIIISSFTLFMSLRAVRTGNQRAALWLVLVTFALGMGFVWAQVRGWNDLTGMGMGYTVTQTEEGQEAYRWNPLGKLKGEYGKDYFITLRGLVLEKVEGEYYLPGDEARQDPKTAEVMSTFNAAGALLGVLIFVHIIHLAFGLIYLLVNSYRIYRNRIHRTNWISLYAGGMYWHFMGLLWLYLFFFMFYIY